MLLLEHLDHFQVRLDLRVRVVVRLDRPGVGLAVVEVDIMAPIDVAKSPKVCSIP